MTSIRDDLSENAKWHVQQIIQARIRMEWTLALGEDADHQPILSLENRDRIIRELKRDIRYYKYKQDPEPLKKEVAKQVVPLLEHMVAILENAPEKMDFDPEEPIRPKPLSMKDAINQGQFAQYVENAFRRRRAVWAGISQKYKSGRHFAKKEIKDDFLLLLGDSKQLQLLGHDDSEASKVIDQIVDVNRKQIKAELNRLATRLEKHPTSVTDQQIHDGTLDGVYTERWDEYHGIDGGVLDLLQKIEKLAERRRR